MRQWMRKSYKTYRKLADMVLDRVLFAYHFKVPDVAAKWPSDEKIHPSVQNNSLTKYCLLKHHSHKKNNSNKKTFRTISTIAEKWIMQIYV